MTNKLKNFIKAPVKVDFQSLSTFKPQVAAASSFAKTVPNQQFISQQEDEIIENGIKALQHRLQAPLEISAVAKSTSGCGRRLCKEKSKTQQAKTRENIGNRGNYKILKMIFYKAFSFEQGNFFQGYDVKIRLGL